MYGAQRNPPSRSVGGPYSSRTSQTRASTGKIKRAFYAQFEITFSRCFPTQVLWVELHSLELFPKVNA